MMHGTLRRVSAVTTVARPLRYVEGGACVTCPDCADGYWTRTRGHRQPGGRIDARDTVGVCLTCGGTNRRPCVWCSKPASGHIAAEPSEPVCEGCGHEIEREGA